MLEGKKIVTSDEMSRIESLAYTQGHLELDFMDKAGAAIAEIVCRFAKSDQIIILAGKGNNGGDAFTAGIHLLEKKFSVKAVHPYSMESSSPLCQTKARLFQEAGGKIHSSFSFDGQGLIIDGLVGTGFQGKAEGVLADTIIKANQSGLPILSIDIPSGLNGTTGEVRSFAIHATATIYLGLPKLGFFIGTGWDHVGDLIYADFGLPQKFIDAAKAEAYLISEEKLFLPTMKRSRHKYESGYVLGVSGSESMPGAAALSSLATLRAGAGIIRLFHDQGMQTGTLPWEVIHEPYSLERIEEEAKRASAIFIGPGMGRSRTVRSQLSKLFALLTHPVVIDADALHFVPHLKIPPKSILTPHRKEMEYLLKGTPATLASCQAYAEEKNVTLVLKGGPTTIFHPRTRPLICVRGNPGMATAGSGDVLTGILAALCAQKVDLRTAAALGTTLHGIAGDIAAERTTAFGMIASDIINTLPSAFAYIASLTNKS